MKMDKTTVYALLGSSALIIGFLIYNKMKKADDEQTSGAEEEENPHKAEADTLLKQLNENWLKAQKEREDGFSKDDFGLRQERLKIIEKLNEFGYEVKTQKADSGYSKFVFVEK